MTHSGDVIEAQCEFRRGCGTVDQMWVMRQVAEKAAEYTTLIFLYFINLTQAYNSVNHRTIVVILSEYGVPHAPAGGRSSKISTQKPGTELGQ